MKAAVLYGARDLRVVEVPRPRPGPGELLLQVTSAGICGSDAGFYQRGFGTQPVILGHEFAGTVVERGRGASLATGTLVASGAGISCGRCARCAEGRTNLCQSYSTLGANVDGGLAEFVVVPEAICVPTEPYGVAGDAAGLAQPVSIACHAVARGRLSGGDRVLVLGAGGIGAFVVWVASRRGCEITVSDLAAERLAIAARLGAHATVLAGDPLGGPWDVVIDTSGADAPLQAGLKSVRRGGRVVLLGMHHAPRALDLSWLTYGELDVLGTQAHVCATDLPAALAALGARAEGWADVAPTVLPLASVVERGILPLVDGAARPIKTLIDPRAVQERPYAGVPASRTGRRAGSARVLQ